MKEYKDLISQAKDYWSNYGGSSALLRSPFLHLALLISCFSFFLWFNQPWWDKVISIIPSLLGFSLGGYAIWLAIGDEKFKSLLAGSDNGETSPFMELNYAFAHFILMQMFAFIYAVTVSGLSKIGGYPIIVVLISGFIGYSIFIYAITSAFATVIAIVQYSKWYEEYINLLEQDRQDSEMRKKLELENKKALSEKEKQKRIAKTNLNKKTIAYRLKRKLQ